MTRSGLRLVVAALLLQAPAVRAAQLDKDSCSKLKTEQAQLEHGGARGNLAKGPEWGKANLTPEKLEFVRRLIEVDEMLLFRCGGRPLVILPSDPDPAARREHEGKEGAKAAPAAAPKATTGAKKAVPLKKAAAPVEPVAKDAAKEAPLSDPVPLQPAAAAASPAPPPAKEAAKEAPASTSALPTPPPPPQSAPAPEAPPAAAPPPPNEVAKVTPPAQTAPQPAAVPASPAPPPPSAQPSQPTAAAPAALAPAAAPTSAPAVPIPPAVSAKEAEAKKAAALKAVRAKARKKAEDAYHPPAPDWAANPFVGQEAPAAKK